MSFKTCSGVFALSCPKIVFFFGCFDDTACISVGGDLFLCHSVTILESFNLSLPQLSQTGGELRNIKVPTVYDNKRAFNLIQC